jgi:Arc/MetJ-type ribon-helix-helix transcriptional regulator
LPEDLADEVTARVSSGAYASESDVLREGLRALGSLEAEAEDWIAREAALRFDAWAADPSRAAPAATVFARVRDTVSRSKRP